MKCGQDSTYPTAALQTCLVVGDLQAAVRGSFRPERTRAALHTALRKFLITDAARRGRFCFLSWPFMSCSCALRSNEHLLAPALYTGSALPAQREHRLQACPDARSCMGPERERHRTGPPAVLGRLPPLCKGARCQPPAAGAGQWAVGR